ncbi:MAG TPA: Asp-tRNA(Asn)/Glu-tRNA(Gln) amidotransferase subunit GatB [Gemmatimonadaceae bacterium]|nr:Asp-tRNA(Asn)/Glu-tRNA(Gln) amidotransferase subunit GatB [Gemmatimonadaceae bacterium]
MSGYEMVVGLEVHVQLSTHTKVFCGCSTDFGAPPNTNTCPVCLGLPGALPVLNQTAVRLAARAAAALGCTLHERSVFARKHYFYPDLPKGYQISQYDQPLATKGELSVAGASGAMYVRINRVHMEEDAGKSIHDRYPDATAIDLNRAGTPLIEIVTEPDIRSSHDAREYLRELKLILEYLEVSDANMEEGSLRVDANISARRKGDTALGTKTEIKNMNSFSAVERALDAEFARQCGLLDRGERIVQQTMLWDANRSEIRPARSKEESHDYRYFPDPDLPPLVVGAAWLSEIRSQLPELPAARRERLRAAYAIAPNDTEVLTSSRALADYYEGVAKAHGDGRTAASWVVGDVLAALNNEGIAISDFRVLPRALAELLDLVRDGRLSRNAAKQVFAGMRSTGQRAAEIAEREGLLQVSDDAALTGWIDAVWDAHPAEAQRYAAGEQKLLGVLVGLVMKESKGRADPKRVNQLLAARVPPAGGG